MTINSAARKAGPFLGDGVTTGFPFTFKVFTKNDVQVTLTNSSGAETQLVLDSDYTVSLNSDQTVSPGGTVTYPATLATGYKLTITGALQNLQPTSLPNNGPFYPKTIEDAEDRAVILIQQLQEKVDRSIKVNVSDAPLASLPAAGSRANTVLGFDAIGGITTMSLPPSVGAGDMRVDTFTAGADFTAGVTVALTLSRAPGSPANLEIFFDGVFQGPDQWTLAGQVVTFNSAIPGGVGKVFARTGTTLSTQIPPVGSISVPILAPDVLAYFTAAGYASLATGAVARSVQSKLNDVVNIKDFGAKGDGVTNDVPAYNLAIAYANSRTTVGTTIFFPDGQYNLAAGGLSAITAQEVHLVGASSSGACLILPSGQAAIQFGSGSSGLLVGGGARQLKLKYTGTPAAGSVVFRFEYVSRLSFDDLLIENIMTLCWAGATAARFASALYFRGVKGSFYNAGNYSAFELRYGAGLVISDCATFVAGVLAPTNPNPMTTALNTNVINCVTGNWDTLLASNSSFERFDNGLVVIAGSGMVYQDLYFQQCIFDYHKSSIVVLNSATGGVVSTVEMHNCWYAAWEQDAIIVSSTGGYNDNHEFTGKVVLAGKTAVNYAMAGAKSSRFDLEIGAVGRVGGITAAMNFATTSTGFHVTNCRGNDDNTAVGFPWRAPYGILVGANCDTYVVSDNRLAGSTAGYNIVDNSSGSANRRVSNNANANYAGVSQGMALPASGATFTNTKSFPIDCFVFGGTVSGITVKGAGVSGMTNGSFRLDPGETFSITYSVAPGFTTISVA